MTTYSEAVQFLNMSIKPALQKTGLSGRASEELLLGTALVESDLIHRRQIGGGPARGLFQMEPATHDDIWNNYLQYRPELGKSIISLMTSPDANKHLELEQNDKYACAMARTHYLRVPATLPMPGDVEAMAGYWKQYYNTPLGAGTVSKYVRKWTLVMGNR
jgi:hypothetical protein